MKLVEVTREIKAFQIGGPLGGVVPINEIDNLKFRFSRIHF